MGKTTTPLHILVHPVLWDTPEVRALTEKGHLVGRLEVEGDLIVGPTCWRIVPELVGNLTLAITAAQRAIKAGKPKKGKL